MPLMIGDPDILDAELDLERAASTPAEQVNLEDWSKSPL